MVYQWLLYKIREMIGSSGYRLNRCGEEKANALAKAFSFHKSDPSLSGGLESAQ